MKIVFNQKLNQSAEFLIRRCGYGLVRDPRASEVSYSRRLGGGIYPRFHLYVNSENPLILNLHLDQKQASYEGYTKHSGDYDSDLVKQEGQRIYNTIVNEMDPSPFGPGQGERVKDNKEESDDTPGFFARLFGRK
ncbi:MAG: hypothetical protein NT116_04365 [Candidatus Parcubacteria bacterium]|nr:hypothetical protein [Candidatus Parcubacteria bacterium]